MHSRITGDSAVGCASPSGDGGTSVERVLCLFDPGEQATCRFVRTAVMLANGGRLVVPVENASVAQSLKPEATDAPVSYETRFLERPPRITNAWVKDVVDRFDITIIFDIRDRKSVLGGGELAFASRSTHVTVTPGTEDDSISSCLVPVTRGPHLDATLDVARAVAESNDAWLDLFHVVQGDGRERETDALFQYCTERLDGFEDFDTWRYEGSSPAEAIVDQSSYYDTTIVAAPRKGRLREFVDGSTTEIVQSLCDNTVVTVRSGDVDFSRLDRWLGEFLAPKR
ncbi:universal stress protein [Halogeometricum limi]|uniref:Nucleotide-binding universal stress protein, UspA family n=1 Tax=Halogeometricum limi TaxID=555875 RepID=A0A1I6I9E4_9EURY|nr:universal stress protein [Halogeometricum limi]SFR63323.1 Nucleotide-binding universal stress protein, UspA family [Halogeometricum limi]